MELILLKTQKEITEPFVFKSGLSVFSLEQAMWHIYNNWREDDFLSPDFEKWVSSTLELQDVAKDLANLRTYEIYANQLFSFLSIIPYFDQLDLSTLQSRISSWEGDNQQTMLNNRAIELFNSGDNFSDKSLSVDLFRQAYEIDKTNLEVMLNYSQALVENGNSEKAFVYVRKAENMCEDLGIKNSKVFYLYAKICRKLRNMDQALSYIKKAIMYGTGSPNINDYHYELAEIQIETRRYNDAIEELKEAPHKNFSYYMKLATVYDASGDYAGAIKAINAAHTIATETPISLAILAGYHRKNYDLDNAKQIIEKITDIEQHPFAQIELAKIKKESGRLGEYQKIMDGILVEAKRSYREENGWT